MGSSAYSDESIAYFTKHFNIKTPDIAAVNFTTSNEF